LLLHKGGGVRNPVLPNSLSESSRLNGIAKRLTQKAITASFVGQSSISRLKLLKRSVQHVLLESRRQDLVQDRQK